MLVVLFASLNIFPLLSKKINWERKDLTITKFEKKRRPINETKDIVKKKKWLKFCSGMSSLPPIYFFSFSLQYFISFIFLSIFFSFWDAIVFQTILFFYVVKVCVFCLCLLLTQTQMQLQEQKYKKKKDTVLQVSSQTRKRDFSVGLTTYPFQI